MIQNVIALFIVFSVVAYTIYSLVRSLTVKKAAGKCSGCQGCSVKELPGSPEKLDRMGAKY